jgi:hypothetical protein
MPYNYVRSFEEWVITWFDHPATTQEEYEAFRSRYVTYPRSPRREIVYATQAFENAETVFAPYSNDQIGIALRSMVSRGTNCLTGLLNRQIPKTDRERCAASILVLYEQLFAKRCLPYLSHVWWIKPRPKYNLFNDLCYMWWELIPVTGVFSGQTYVDDWFLDVMLKVIALDSEACRESALNGLLLFHYTDTYDRRPEIRHAIDAFLAAHPYISPELRAYPQRPHSSRWR